MSDKKGVATGTFKITSRVVTFVGKDDETKRPVAFTGQCVPAPGDVMDDGAKFYYDNIDIVPGFHTFTGTVGTTMVTLNLDSPGLILSAKCQLGQQVPVTGNGVGSVDNTVA